MQPPVDPSSNNPPYPPIGPPLLVEGTAYQVHGCLILCSAHLENTITVELGSRNYVVSANSLYRATWRGSVWIELEPDGELHDLALIVANHAIYYVDGFRQTSSYEADAEDRKYPQSLEFSVADVPDSQFGLVLNPDVLNTLKPDEIEQLIRFKESGTGLNDATWPASLNPEYLADFLALHVPDDIAGRSVSGQARKPRSATAQLFAALLGVYNSLSNRLDGDVSWIPSRQKPHPRYWHVAEEVTLVRLLEPYARGVIDIINDIHDAGHMATGVARASTFGRQVYQRIAEHGIKQAYSRVTGENSQYVRPIGKVTSRHEANCIELALFYAACMYSGNYHPIVLILQDTLGDLSASHAMPGFWLDNRGSDAPAILRNQDELYGLRDEAVLLEITKATVNGEPFTKAVEQGKRILDDDRWQPRYALDVKQAVSLLRPFYR